MLPLFTIIHPLVDACSTSVFVVGGMPLKRCSVQRVVEMWPQMYVRPRLGRQFVEDNLRRRPIVDIWRDPNSFPRFRSKSAQLTGKCAKAPLRRGLQGGLQRDGAFPDRHPCRNSVLHQAT